MYNKKFIDHLQEYVIKLLGFTGSVSLAKLSKYNCSEVSRILGLNILKKLGKESKPVILKCIWKDGTSHDVLSYYDSVQRKFIVIDPTIWQFFPGAETIFLGSFGTLENCLHYLREKYEGEWTVSDYIREYNLSEEEDLKKILQRNLEE